MNWDEYFIRLAHQVSTKSKDPSTKVGCVLVGPENQILSTGFNGFPRGVDESDLTRWERPIKYAYVEHAERNAVYNAARHGIVLRGARAYLNWEPVPCIDCSKALAQSGIIEIVGPNRDFTKSYDWNMEVSRIILSESGVTMRVVNMQL